MPNHTTAPPQPTPTTKTAVTAAALTLATLAFAAGAACGLLSGEGWYLRTIGPPWTAPLTGVADLLHGATISDAVRLGLPLVVLVWLATARRLWRDWPLMLVGLISCAALTALLWRLLHVAHAYL
ncbi:hypothetical protein ACQP2X_24330 [Actinoplanes sp. CA-131856]